MASLEERIKAFNSNRIPFYVAKKYAFMRKGAFAFFRGTCHLFYEDLPPAGKLPESPAAWICGDLHLENFGSFKATNRLVHFDITDFDESILAPVSWDLFRITSSIFVALNQRGCRQKQIAEIIDLFIQKYAVTLREGKACYLEQQTTKGIIRELLDKVATRRQKDLISKRTTPGKNGPCLKTDNEKFFGIDDKKLKQALIRTVSLWTQNHKMPYRDCRVLDAAFRVAGTGSVGLKRFVFLLKEAEEEKYLLIDMKQSVSSSLLPYSVIQQPVWPSEADRIKAIQQRMQNITPAHISTAFFNDESYLLKEMHPTEDKIQFDLIPLDTDGIAQTIKKFALLAASAHLRSSGRQGSASADDLVAFGNDSGWQKNVLDYSIAYGKQVQKDFNAYARAYDKNFFSQP